MSTEKLLEEAEYILLEGDHPNEEYIDTMMETWRALVTEGYALPKNTIQDAEELASVRYEPTGEL